MLFREDQNFLFCGLLFVVCCLVFVVWGLGFVVLVGLVWFGLVGLVWFGWFGLVGLVWFGLVGLVWWLVFHVHGQGATPTLTFTQYAFIDAIFSTLRALGPNIGTYNLEV